MKRRLPALTAVLVCIAALPLMVCEQPDFATTAAKKAPSMWSRGLQNGQGS